MDELKQYHKELSKQVIKKFQRRPVITLFNNDIWAMDLLDVNKFKTTNKNIVFLLVVVDIYSRYAFVEPIKEKSGEIVLDAFKKIVLKAGIPKNLWVDEGKEFYNQYLKNYNKENNINMYHTYSGLKSSYAERFNRTLRDLIYKYLNLNKTKTYINNLQDIVKEYNLSVHSSTGETPYSIYFEDKLSKKKTSIKDEETKFKIGDYVRISKTKNLFEKGYTPKWSNEVFEIYEIDNKQVPVMYLIKDLKNEELKGKFYNNELQVSQVKDFKEFEKIVKTKTENRIKKYFVSFKGLPEKFNIWVDGEELKRLKS